MPVQALAGFFSVGIVVGAEQVYLTPELGVIASDLVGHLQDQTVGDLIDAMDTEWQGSVVQDFSSLGTGLPDGIEGATLHEILADSKEGLVDFSKVNGVGANFLTGCPDGDLQIQTS